MRLRVLVVLLNLFAAGFYLVVGWLSGFLTHVDSSIFSSFDSQTYRDVADWLFGARSNPHASIWRPFLYPLLLGAEDRAAGPYGVWLLNLALWFTTLNVAAAATYRLVKSRLATALVFVVLATNISLIVLTFEGVTETTVIALLAIWVYGLTRLTWPPRPWQVVWMLLPMSLLVLVKPEFEFLLVFLIIVLSVGVVRGPAPVLGAAAVVACVVPVGIQLAIMARFNHYLGISDIGSSTIRGDYLSRLIATITHTTFEAVRPQVAGWSNLQVAQYVLAHLGDAIAVFFSILGDNLLADSAFLSLAEHRRLQDAIVATNWIYLVALIALVPLVALAMWRARDWRLALICAAILNILAAGGLSYRQGDRLTVIALPLGAVAFALALQHVRTTMGWAWPRAGRAQGP